MGLYSGLVESGAEWCFVVGGDMPFLSPAVIGHMAAFRGDTEIVAARIKGRVQPLHAFYSGRCLPAAEELLSSGTSSLQAVLTRCRATIVPERELIGQGGALLSFRDIDTPEELAWAEARFPSLTASGLPAERKRRLRCRRAPFPQ